MCISIASQNVECGRKGSQHLKGCRQEAVFSQELILVFYGHCNKLKKINSIKSTNVLSHCSVGEKSEMILSGLKSRCQQVCSGRSRQESSTLSFLPSRDHTHFLTHGLITPSLKSKMNGRSSITHTVVLQFSAIITTVFFSNLLRTQVMRPT